MRKEDIERKLQAAFPDGLVAVRDFTGGGDHWEATVVSAAFAGLSMLEQHRLVHAALAEELKGPIHALTLKTSAPRAGG